MGDTKMRGWCTGRIERLVKCGITGGTVLVGLNKPWWEIEIAE